ncbi:MAG: ribosome small subunit-dependent GTPase A [Bdellovibrionaceae bacterium]|nr:ribosome small subunit-dependent GTPase A [Pseudobdellovibrionaceae bacterium]|tara:strand:- start:48708 stop:49739 length:1032 start_codon:yes stop_codon:yes gene_type:complete
MNLKTLGWPSDMHQDIDVSSLARVTAVHRSHMRALTEKGEINLHIPGSLEDLPVVGDWVLTTPEFEDEQGEPARLVKEVLTRSSILARWTDRGEQPMAANVDTVFIVTSANLDFKLNRLHRFILLVRKGGAEPVVILSKTDLVENSSDLVREIEDKLQLKVIGTSIVNDSGMAKVLELMPEGSTSVFVGSSGVGKSSLVNRIMGEEVQLTSGIREDDAKGRHTTTARQMFVVDGHGLIIDTPGVREVQIFGDADDVVGAFPLIEELSQQCKFSNCHHETEPGCAIQEALDSGALDVGEWESYLKLQREADHVKRKMDKADMANAKKRWKKVSRLVREIKKSKR